MSNFLAMTGVRRVVAVVTLGFLLASPATSCASLIVQVESRSLPAAPTPTSSFVDVFFKVTGSNPNISGYQVRLDLMPSDSRVVLGAPIKTDAFAPPRVPLFSTPPIDLGSGAGVIRATDLLSTGSKVILDQDGLVRIPFTIAAAAIGTFDLKINLADTALSDALGSPIPFTAANGQIVVTTVPEPSSAVLVVLAIVTLLGSRLCRKSTPTLA